MDLKNYMNDQYNKIEKSEMNKYDNNNEHYEIKNSTINEYTVNFEVLTEGLYFWVSCADMKKICSQISQTTLESIGIRFDVHKLFGEDYISVNESFLIYVQKNTKNPKYVPVLALLNVLERSQDYSSIEKLGTSMAISRTVDDQTVVEEQIERSRRL